MKGNKLVRISRYSGTHGLGDARDVDLEVEDKVSGRLPAQEPSPEVVRVRESLENYQSIGQITEGMTPQEKEEFRKNYLRRALGG